MAQEPDVVVHVFVIRRELDVPLGFDLGLGPVGVGAVHFGAPRAGSLPKVGLLAHSALLVKTMSGAYHVIEFGATGFEFSSTGPKLHVHGAARSYPVQVETLSSDAEGSVETVKLIGNGEEVVWTKQLRGKAVPDRPGGRRPTVEETRNKMQELMCGTYGLGRTCHDAQESTRKWLGVWDEEEFRWPILFL